jgi:DNA-directed RNA polymerase subunit RPC12/RpoP
MTALVVVWVLCGIVGAVIAESRGRNALGWGLFCLLTGVLGVFIVAVSPRPEKKVAVETQQTMQRWQVLCAHCERPLRAQVGESIGCPHCRQRMKVRYDEGVVTAEALPDSGALD